MCGTNEKVRRLHHPALQLGGNVLLILDQITDKIRFYIEKYVGLTSRVLHVETDG